MKKHSDATPMFHADERVKVAHQEGSVVRTLEDGRILVEFDNGTRQPVDPDKVSKP
jgi:hypothetical protein